MTCRQRGAESVKAPFLRRPWL